MSDINKHVGKFISKEEADKHIKNWKKKGIKTESSFFGSDKIFEILNSSPNVVGIRIHYAMDDEGNMQPVLAPELDETATTQLKASSSSMLLDTSLGCPPYCPK